MMESQRIYLDNCCFNRPFDDQSQLTIRMETEAFLFIMDKIREKTFELIWSSIVDFENKRNPFDSRRKAVDGLRELASCVVDVTDDVKKTSLFLQSRGLDLVDSLHVACAIDAKCEYFISTDHKLLKNPLNKSMLSILCVLSKSLRRILNHE